MTNKWPTTTISDISENLDSKRVPVAKLKRKSGDIPYYGATGIVDYVNDYIFDEELLLIGEDGADWSGGANTAFIINGKSWVNNHAHVLRIKNANIQFVMNYLNYSDLRNYISGTTRGKLNQASLNKIKILNPSLKIQAKVADILSTIDETIEKTDQIIQKTEKLKQGLMSELLTKGIGHKKFKKTKLGEIPEEWEIKMLSLVAKVVDSLHQTPKYSGDGLPMVRVIDIKQGDLDLSSCIKVEKKVYDLFTKNHVPAQGDIVISRVGSFGVFSYVATTKQFCLGQNTAIISPLINGKYLYYALQSPIPTEQVAKQVVGSNQKTLSLKHIKNLYVPKPSSDEQQKIADILCKLDIKIESEIKQKNTLISLKKGLMQDIFSQKVTIN
ncbi:MAG: restriction endonuclease subunit S [Pseudomonadales bacterium]|nr:restriction endonuclease subunit S [Pseudomonadales bacterium]